MRYGCRTIRKTSAEILQWRSGRMHRCNGSDGSAWMVVRDRMGVLLNAYNRNQNPWCLCLHEAITTISSLYIQLIGALSNRNKNGWYFRVACRCTWNSSILIEGCWDDIIGFHNGLLTAFRSQPAGPPLNGPSVCPKMSFQLIASTETFRTVFRRTFVGFLTCVRSHMPLLVFQSMESSWTNFTSKWSSVVIRGEAVLRGIHMRLEREITDIHLLSKKKKRKRSFLMSS